MNEELKIIIKAVVNDAKKGLNEVQKELAEIEKAASEASRPVDTAMRAVSKSAMIAVGGVVALTTALTTLGKRSLEFQKIQGQLNAGFQSVGLSAQQASATYKELFGFLGEADTAVETANLLAQLTQEEKHLAEWTQILQGVYAKFPSSLPVESLAESINHTAQLGEVNGNLSDALEWVGVSVDSFNAKLATTTSVAEREALIRSTLNNLYMGASVAYSQANQALIQYNQSQYALDSALANATAYVIPLMTALNNLAATLLSVLRPAFENISAVIIAFVQWIIAAIKAVGAFFGIFSSKGSASTDNISNSLGSISQNTNKVTSGVNKVGGAFDKAAQSAQKLRRQVMGFDELNVIQPQQSASTGSAAGSGAGGGGIEIPEVSIPDIDIPEIDIPGLAEFEEKVASIQKYLTPILTLVGLIGMGLLAWKIADIISEFTNLNKFIELSDDLLERVGKEGFEAAFGEGSTGKIQTAKERLGELQNKLKTFLGICLIIAGVLLTVYGFSDAWVNGLDWGNLAMMIGGISLAVTGLYLAFGPVAAAIGLVVGGIVLLIAGIKDLITNGYSMEAVLAIAAGAIAVVVGLVWAFNAALLANPITWVVVGIMALVAAFVILWNECEGFRKFWINLWDGIVKAFNATVDWLGKACTNIGKFFKDAGAKVKEIWNAIPGWFSNIGQKIKDAFSFVVSWFGSIFSKAWSGIKSAFSNVGSFFTGIWNTIKNIFSKVGSTIGSAVSNAFSNAINWVLKKAISIINGFISAINLAIGIINKIPGVNITKLSKLDVPQLAKGGIVDSATLAVIGERGKEAVLPLENNTGWMDALAEKIAARNGSPSRIVLMVDGKELGYATINSINGITRQTGQLQLALV